MLQEGNEFEVVVKEKDVIDCGDCSISSFFNDSSIDDYCVVTLQRNGLLGRNKLIKKKENMLTFLKR